MGQKLDIRRAFWATGASTRLDVKLGAFIDPARSRTRASVEDWTDLDVLGVTYSPLSGTGFVVADCKTTKTRVTERVFWLRGVADLFGARAAFLTRDAEIPEAARQLALRLGIATMDAADRAAFSTSWEPRTSPLPGLFSSSTRCGNGPGLHSRPPTPSEGFSDTGRASTGLSAGVGT